MNEWPTQSQTWKLPDDPLGLQVDNGYSEVVQRDRHHGAVLVQPQAGYGAPHADRLQGLALLYVPYD